MSVLKRHGFLALCRNIRGNRNVPEQEAQKSNQLQWSERKREDERQGMITKHFLHFLALMYSTTPWHVLIGLPIECVCSLKAFDHRDMPSSIAHLMQWAICCMEKHGSESEVQKWSYNNSSSECSPFVHLNIAGSLSKILPAFANFSYFPFAAPTGWEE